MNRRINHINRRMGRPDRWAVVGLVVGVLCWSGWGWAQPASEKAPGGRPGADKPRYGDYLLAKGKARAWFDQLEVDPVELLKHRVKGKKKLAEILGVYKNFDRHTSDPAEKEGILRRVRELAVHTERPEYHNMQTCSDMDFLQNSMSYFRVMWLMGDFGLDTGPYLAEVRKAKPRMDEHFKKRGPWQRAMFAEYYDRFGLEKPPELAKTFMRRGVIARRLPAEKYDLPKTTPDGQVSKRTKDSYDLTHEVFVAFDYGLQRRQNHLTPEDLAYTREVLPVLVERYIAENNPDLTAEMLSCMTYLGWHSEGAYRAGVDYLLVCQNPNGTWGDYERFRQAYGKYLDQHVYLHTTMVATRALMEVYEGNWKSAGQGEQKSADRNHGEGAARDAEKSGE